MRLAFRSASNEQPRVSLVLTENNQNFERIMSVKCRTVYHPFCFSSVLITRCNTGLLLICRCLSKSEAENDATFLFDAAGAGLLRSCIRDESLYL